MAKKKKKKGLKKEVIPPKGKEVRPVSKPSVVRGDSIRFDILSVIFLCLVTLLLYFFTLNYPFHFDDFGSITDNPYIKNLRNFSFFLDGVRARGSWFRALPTFSFALNYHFHQLDVLGYHLVNLFLHMGSGVLVYLISKRLFGLGLKREEGVSGGREDF